MMLDPLDPVALDGSPAQAFASHRARANGIAKHFAITRPLSEIKEGKQSGEDNTTTLLAHFHTVQDDPSFTPDGAPPSAIAAPAALRQLVMGNGLVGTEGASTKRDYDMALKGLVILVYRYPHLLDTGIDRNKPDFINGVDFILNKLVPDNISGGHPFEIEIVQQSFLNIPTPETENHLLMSESSRYLFNQLRWERGNGDPKFDNRQNGLTTWLLGFMHTIAKHDFLEFNSSPYARLALHALLNLHEFARDEEIRTAAQILLDYTMMKCALSSNRGRRISPFRRQQHRIAHQANWHNYLYVDSGDQVTGFLLAYTGLTGVDENRTPVRLPASHAFNELLAGTAAYRPPPEVYALALNRDNPPSLHRFFHGKRPQLLASFEDAEAGLEIYYHSPSFLLSAGGSFLNSGYGHDEIDIAKHAWEQTSRAQATTLIPTRADLLFHDLVRFESYPDPQVDPYADDPDDPDCYHTSGVNIGVHRGLMAGANLRPAEKKTILENSTSESPALTFHNGKMFIAWKGSGNDNINLATVQTTILFDIDGVEGIEQKVVLGDTTDRAPALASLDNRLFLAWKGSGNDNLSLMFTKDGGKNFRGKTTFAETSRQAPALIAHNGILFLAWTGRGDGNLNVAKVGFTPEGSSVLADKVVLDDTSGHSPALVSHDGRLFIAWKGSGNNNLNLMFSEDDGVTFRGKITFGDSSSHAPALTSHMGRLFIAWGGSGNENLNVARVVLIGNTAGAFGIEGLEANTVLGEISTRPPALGSWNELLVLGWKGKGDDFLNLRVSRDGSFSAPGPWLFKDLTRLGFYLAAYRAPVSRTQDLNPPPDNLGFVYAVEKSDMDARGINFNRFRELTLARNDHFPATLDYDGTYEFHGPDDRNFSIWFKLTEDKYRARVINLDDPLDDLSTLPLVSGEFMSAPGGHDGLIEIRSPQCEVPLVLDFHASESPDRRHNIRDCPGPWLDRAQALLSFAQKLSEAKKHKEEIATLTDRVKIYQQLAEIDPIKYKPDLASALNLLAGNLWALVVRLLEAQRIDEVSAPALEAIQVYRQAAAAGAEVTGIATSLIRLSSWLAHAGLATDSLSAAQAAVDVLRGVQPPASEQISYLALLAQSLRTLVLQLLQTQRIDEVSAPALEAIQVYRQAAAAGAEVTGIAHDLQTLSSWLANARLTAEAVSAAQAAVDVLRGFQLPATEQVAYLTLLAGNLSTLVQWLIDAQRISEVSVPALEAIQVYRQVAAAGAEVTGIATSLRTLSSWLANVGLAAEASAAADAAASILP